MPSRKKAKGQARKAAKAKKEEKLLAEKAKKVEEQFRGFEQSQVQRLQINNQNSVLPIYCMHGFDPFPDDHVCSTIRSNNPNSKTSLSNNREMIVILQLKHLLMNI